MQVSISCEPQTHLKCFHTLFCTNTTILPIPIPPSQGAPEIAKMVKLLVDEHNREIGGRVPGMNGQRNPLTKKLSELDLELDKASGPNSTARVTGVEF